MSPFFRTFIFTILVPGFWTVAMPYWLLARGARPDLRGVSVVGWLIITARAFWGFALRGKGTPAPFDPPKQLVVEGPYHIVRNPMYWSVTSVLLGEAVVFHSLVLAELTVAFFAGTNLFVLFYEEPVLRRKFGAEYEDYCRRVPRWLPRFKNKLD